MTASSAVTTGTLVVPDARLYYEVRGSGPLMVLAGAPMNAAAFAPLAEQLATTNTVLTTDPRGHHASPLNSPDRDSTAAARADDLARLITHLDAGPAVVFGSSGGAVSALALTQNHPDLVTTVVAHEPPLRELLPDADAQRARTDDVIATFVGGDVLGAWRKFFAQADIPIPEAVFEQMFGGERDPRQVASERSWFTHEMAHTTAWVPDPPLLRSVPTRVIVGIGTDSTGQLCDRTSRQLASALGLDPVLFPGDHVGFVDDPVAFAARLREVLDEP
ncbi:alpha/beta fold hydrolase [Nocardia caishijiensis]|uniref:Pimeloyl-ACP methyl ester carboxylesterase n=1 Tax=Nocardia caishijiensis TaxID=184756 RepID=A0ABQ6YMC4_9NOCA|nr:alpha/beta hydrolase [Nocardia caishijiensis]KAF0846930.1 pimeloyl-ACP methyl ester carboxylesterase [Nocardia caishijiensis]